MILAIGNLLKKIFKQDADLEVIAYTSSPAMVENLIQIHHYIMTYDIL